MQIGEIRTLAGPNVYSHQPILVMKLGLGDLYKKESFEIPGFVDRLLERLPGLHEHYCGLGRPGGFVERLREGTYFGHIVEHVALELTDAAGISVNRGKTVEAGEPGWYLVAVAYKSERGMKCLLHIAVELVEALVRNQQYPLEEKLEEARKIVAKYELGPSTRAVVDAAERRGIPWSRVNEDSLVRLGYGVNQRMVEATITDRTRVIGVDLAGNKELTKQVLAQAALPVPRGCVVKSAESAVECLIRLRPPLVVKPLDGNQGRGVSLNLSTPEQVSEAFTLAQEVSRQVIVEEMYHGRDYRVVVVNGKMVAAAERVPPHVWGDGTHTISQLIDFANADPNRGEGHEKPLTKIKTDPVVLAILKKYGRTLEDVPAKGELVALRESANLSTGGSARDVTDVVEPTIRRMCERAARVVGLDVCGIDLVIPDIATPYKDQGGIVEVNAAPGIRMHHHPSEGKPRDVGAAIIDMLYPAEAPFRIPIVSITGTNGKTTVTRMIGHAIGSTGRRVGMTTTDGIWLDGAEIARGDMTGPWSARVSLNEPTVEVAVLETARGGIVRSGLGYDWSDVSVITNFQSDHLGQDGIESIEDIVRIKAVVAERVREGGTLILNADDPRCVTIPGRPKVKRTPKRIVWFSLQADHPVIQSHLAAGETAYVVHGDWIEERIGNRHTRVLRISSAPITLNGSAEFQVANLLAATAACRAYGMELRDIAEALGNFRSGEHNDGRVNLYAMNGGYVLVDYAHNPSALQALCRMVAHWGDRRVTGVLGLPGDRTDALLEESARAAVCGFDNLILKEDEDLRGREPGEVIALMERVAREQHPQMPIRIAPRERDAVLFAICHMQPDEIVVVLCEKVSGVREFLEQQGARPVSELSVPIAATPQPAA